MIGYDYGYLWEYEEFDAPRLLEVMADFNAPWWVAGGWALDLWMERETRPHQDVDVAILRGDQQKLYRSLSQWELYYAAPDHKLDFREARLSETGFPRRTLLGNSVNRGNPPYMRNSLE